jgi:uncharacterized protein (DUF697 family)/tellurite resistance protein
VIPRLANLPSKWIIAAKGTIMNEQEQRGVLSICILAALADGSQSEAERTQIQRIAEGFHRESPELALAYQEVLGQRAARADVVKSLQSPEARSLAYEMAVCVCHADGALSDAERQFLIDLRQDLQLPPESTSDLETQAHQLTRLEPVAVPPRIMEVGSPDGELDRMILNYSILTGALELLPHSLATMAIIPLQMKMVYQVGRQSGFELNRGHITDFLATVGIGLASQVVEGFARKLLGNFTRQIGGRLLGGLAGQAAGSAVAFGTTYALGQVAKRYYASGRTLSTAQLKEVFTSLLSEGNALQTRYTSEIVQKSRQINVSDLLPLVRQS